MKQNTLVATRPPATKETQRSLVTECRDAAVIQQKNAQRIKGWVEDGNGETATGCEDIVRDLSNLIEGLRLTEQKLTIVLELSNKPKECQ